MRETPKQRVKRYAGSRQWIGCSSAPNWTKYGSRCHDLIGQLECGQEDLIGWEAHAHTYAHLVLPGRSIVKSLAHAGFN